MTALSKAFTARIKELLTLGGSENISVETRQMGWGTGFRSGRAIGGDTFLLGGRNYLRGWGDHAQSRHVIKLPGPGKSFEVLVGVQECESSRAPVNPTAHIRFTVWVNGKIAAQSSVLEWSSSPEKLTVDLNGATEFVLQSQETGFPPEYTGTPSCAYACWVEPVIKLADGREFLPGMGFMINELLPAFEYDGVPADLINWQRRTQLLVDDQDMEVYRLEFYSPDGLLTLRCTVKLYKDFPVYEVLPELTAGNSQKTKVVENFHTLSVKSLVPGRQVTVRRISGVKNSPEDFRSETLTIGQRWGRNRVLMDTDWGSSSATWFPYAGIDASEKQGMEVAIGWTGSWKLDIINTINELSITAGMMRTRFFLHPGETLRQPSALIFFREDMSIGDAKRDFRRFMLKYKSPRNSKGELFPGSISFGNGGHIGEKILLDEIDYAKNNNFAIDTFWVDAGWYGPPRSADPWQPCGGWAHWFEEAGDWRVNPVLYPSGTLKTVADKAHAAGLKFLLWFSTECAIAKTPVVREHPEYFFTALNPLDQRRLLDLGNEDAWQWMFDTVAHAVEEFGIDCYRQDFNFTDMTFRSWQNADEPYRIGVTEAKYIAGLYRFWDELKKRFPDLLFDNCASGGRRIDFETVSRCHCYAINDRTEDHDVPEEMQNTIALTVSYAPIQCSCSYKRTFDDPYSAYSYVDSAMHMNMARYHYGLVEFTPEDTVRLKKWAADAARVRDILYRGDYYMLTPYSESLKSWHAWQGDDPAKECGVVVAFRRPESPEAEMELHLHNIKPDARYRLEFHNGEVKELSGSELAAITVALPEKRSFDLFYYIRTDHQKL
ncbi:MAG: hypothetical protein E7058_04740 [Lentisphaerae bacterium]|nr:hypothetical protein [Lentisphaerota bacterium]